MDASGLKAGAYTEPQQQKGTNCAVLRRAEEEEEEENGDIDITSLISHASSVLERLDRHLDAQGGLLALLPPGVSGGRVQAEREDMGILGQWLRYTQSLVHRVAALEGDVVNLRELLGCEMTVAGKASSSNQDRYVLAGLNEALWKSLNGVLDTCKEEGMTEAEKGRGTDQIGRTRDLDAGGEVAAGGKNMVTWVEVTSRIFRIEGRDSVFVIPGWDLHPGADAVRRVERGPLVQTVVRRSGRCDGEDGTTAKDRNEDIDNMALLTKENEELKAKVKFGQEQHSLWDDLKMDMEEEMDELRAQLEMEQGKEVAEDEERPLKRQHDWAHGAAVHEDSDGGGYDYIE